jgi:hypothetical protein
LPEPREIEKLYDKVQFYPTGGGGELTDEFYGETWIPEPWIKDKHASLGFRSYDFLLEFGAIDQCVVVLTKA